MKELPYRLAEVITERDEARKLNAEMERVFVDMVASRQEALLTIATMTAERDALKAEVTELKMKLRNMESYHSKLWVGGGTGGW